jgi:hypothetical protein
MDSGLEPNKLMDSRLEPKKLTKGGLAGLTETDSRLFVNGSRFQSQKLKDSGFDTPYGGLIYTCTYYVCI